MSNDLLQVESRRGFRRLLPKPPAFPDEDKSRQARLAYMAAWVLFVVPLLYGLIRLLTPGGAGLFEGTQTSGALLAGSVILPLAIACISLFCMWLLHGGLVRTASAILVGASWLALVMMSARLGGVRDVSFAGLMIPVVLSGLLLGGPASAIVVVASLIAGWGLADAETSGTLLVEADGPVEVLVGYLALFSIAAGLVAAANAGYKRLMGRVYQTEREMRAQNWELQQMRDSLEQRVAARTEDLNRRSGYLEAAARVAYAAGEILDVEGLLGESVELIREAFGLYYVGLFLVQSGAEEDLDAASEADGNGESRPWAVLRAGTGDAGHKMLARGHRIRVGDGMVGWSIAQAQSRFAQHAEEDRVRLVAPELPETRAEAALPLRTRGRVVGALTVQSAQSDFFDEDTVTVLQTMADLIAVALSNAELFEESEMAMQALRRAYGEISAGAWQDLLRRQEWGYRYNEGVVQPLRGSWRTGSSAAVGVSELAMPVGGAGTDVVIPMRIGGTDIGAIRFQRRADESAWEADDVTLLNALTEQLVQALDSARLLQETQRQAAREQQVSEIAALLANSVDVDTMLRATVQELGRLPGVLEASVYLASGEVGADLTARERDRGNGDHG